MRGNACPIRGSLMLTFTVCNPIQNDFFGSTPTVHNSTIFHSYNKSKMTAKPQTQKKDDDKQPPAEDTRQIQGRQSNTITCPSCLSLINLQPSCAPPRLQRETTIPQRNSSLQLNPGYCAIPSSTQGLWDIDSQDLEEEDSEDQDEWDSANE